MNTTTCTHKDNPNFWIFGLFFFLYFFIMATCFPFLPIWLSDVIGLNKTETGIVFSSLSLFAICFQPVLGVISDKLGLKKHLMWVVSVLLVLIAPFFLLRSLAYRFILMLHSRQSVCPGIAFRLPHRVHIPNAFLFSRLLA